MCFAHFCHGQWSQIGADINGEAPNDESGFVVSLSADGKRVAIGARLNNNTMGTLAGHVRVYDYSGGNWVQLGNDIDGEAAGDQSGYALSLSPDGSRVAIGAPFNGGNGANAGHVRVYEFLSGAWTKIGADIDGEAAQDRSGTSVSLSFDGNKLAIGAYLNDGNGPDAGQVRIFEYKTGTWLQLGNDIDGEAAGDYSGSAVSLSSDGNRIAIGAYLNDGNGVNAGHVRIFEFNGTSWVQLGNDIDGESAGDISGYAVSLSAQGNNVAIGAIYNNGNGLKSGHARVYQYLSGIWIQLGSDIDGAAAGNEFGYSLSISSNGEYLGIGAIKKNGSGFESGHVRVFKNISSAWVQVNDDINGEVANDWSGNSVSMSSNGKTIAIGARLNDGNGNNSGHMRVFTCDLIYNITDMLFFCSLEDALIAASTNDGDVLQIPSGNYYSSCYTINKSITLTPMDGPVILNCLDMNGNGKALTLGGNMTIHQLSLSNGKIKTNGFNLKCNSISGGMSTSYIVTD